MYLCPCNSRRKDGFDGLEPDGISHDVGLMKGEKREEALKQEPRLGTDKDEIEPLAPADDGSVVFTARKTGKLTGACALCAMQLALD